MIEKMAFLPYVFLGGGFGASLRWLTSISIAELGAPLWTGTFLVNCLGTMIFFILAKIGFGEPGVQQHLVRVGLLGSLTTFSTFSYEVFSAYKQGDSVTALLIFSLNILAGVVVAIGVFR